MFDSNDQKLKMSAYQPYPEIRLIDFIMVVNHCQFQILIEFPSLALLYEIGLSQCANDVNSLSSNSRFIWSNAHVIYNSLENLSV